LNVHGDNDLRQTEMYTAEPYGSEPISFEVRIATEKLKDINQQTMIKSRQK